MSGVVQAPALVPEREALTVTVDLADALQVGLSIQGLIAQGEIPAGAVAPFDRLSRQLVAAARAAAKGAGQ